MNSVAQYDYVDEFGELLYQVLRLEPKSFRQRRPDGHGGFSWELNGVRRVPYRLPELLGSPPEIVFVPEGERDCESLRELGLIATTNSGGCGSGWSHELTPYFTGREIVVLSDNDGPGLERADKTAAALHPVAKSVRLVWLPGLPEHGDVTDWLEAGHTREELEVIVAETPLWEPPPEQAENSLVSESAIVPPTPVQDDWPSPMASEAFIGIAGDFVHVMESQTESDHAALLTNFLVASGVMFGRERYALADGKHHYPIESLVMAGPTGGGRKGTGTDRVLTVMYQADAGFYDRKIGGLSSGEGLIQKVSKKMSEAPGEVGCFLIVLPEFGSLLSVMKRDSNTLSHVVRQAWDGDRLEVSTRKDPLDVDNVNISLIGNVTPAELLNSLTATDRANGFGNRLLIQCVRRSKFLPEGGEDVDTRAIVSRLRAAVAAAKGRGRIGRDSAAREIWAEQYPHLARSRAGIAGAMCARAEAHTLRLSLIYALLDSAESIRSEHLRAALAVWNFCENSVNHIFGQTSGDADADRITGALASGPLGMTELQRLFSNNRDSDWIKAKMASLVRAGSVAPTVKRGENKSMPAWELKR